MPDDPTPEPKADDAPKQEPPKPEVPEPESEPFDKERAMATIKKQRESEAALKAKLKEAEAAQAKLEEYEDRDKSETEKLAKSVSRAEQQRDEALAKLNRYEVAAEKKLPAELVDLLSGTREEMAEKADLLLEHMADKKPPPDFDGGVREPAPENQTPEQAHAAFLAREVFGTPRQPQEP